MKMVTHPPFFTSPPPPLPPSPVLYDLSLKGLKVFLAVRVLNKARCCRSQYDREYVEIVFS